MLKMQISKQINETMETNENGKIITRKDDLKVH